VPFSRVRLFGKRVASLVKREVVMKFILSLTATLSFTLFVPSPLSSLASQDVSLQSHGIMYSFGFQTSQNGWSGGFCDYPAADVGDYDLIFARRTLPGSLDPTRWGLYMSGANYSDDLFMYVRRRITGLRPCATYRVYFNIEIATNAPSGCIGIGDSPGEGVCVKAGASTIKPISILEEGWYRMNVDKGNQYEPGANAVILGNIANTNTDCDNPRWLYKTLDSGWSFVRVRTDSYGNLWLFVGTDSGFEGVTSLYYTRITALLVNE
jgi:hypothetical protein